MTTEKLARQANQIAAFFSTQPGPSQADAVAQHINDFWEPRMRDQLARHMAAGGEGLHPLVKEAFAQVKVPA